MKKVSINPGVYAVLLVVIFTTTKLGVELLVKEKFINNAQKIALYLFFVAFIVSSCYLIRYIKFYHPIKFSKDQLIIKRFFSKDIILTYKDIIKVEFYNTHSSLLIFTKSKKYSFSYLKQMNL